jgi:multidrug efflux pump subunit AcrB
VHIHQVVDYPEIQINVDRSKAGLVGLTQRDVSNSLLISLSSSGQISPTQWLDWNTGVSYNVAVQTPQYRIDSLAALMRTPVTSPIGGILSTTPASLAGTANAGVSAVGAGPSQATAAYGNPGTMTGGVQLLENLAGVARGVAPEIVNHYNVQPVYDVYANVDRRDLGAVGSAVEKIVQQASKNLPRGTTIDLRGQVDTMETSFYRLGLGLIFAVVLVYLLMAVNFQSWLDPFIILMALPGALAGIVWMLFITQTTFSVPSLMGSIMCIGVATANSILLVVFANDQREEGLDARAAALSAGYTRIRPGADDGGCHDYRHAADGPGNGRGRGTERASRPRRDRGPDPGYHHHAVCGSIGVQFLANEATRRSCAQDGRGRTGIPAGRDAA